MSCHPNHTELLRAPSVSVAPPWGGVTRGENTEGVRGM